MKCRIKKHNSDNSMMVEYHKIDDIYEFRYNMQHKLLEQANAPAYLFIDTNSNVGVASKRISAMFDEMGIEYTSFKIKELAKRFLGIMPAMRKGKDTKMTQRMYIAKIDKDNYTRELFMQSLCTYDIGIGFDPVMSIEEMQDEFYDEVHSTFFKKKHFGDFVYDSVLFKVFRSTIDVEDNAREFG